VGSSISRRPIPYNLFHPLPLCLFETESPKEKLLTNPASMNTPPAIIPPTTPPPLPSAAQTGNSFARQAALFSLLAPFVSIAINVVGHQAVQGNRAGMLVLGGACTLLILLGFILGIVALLGMKKHGRQGILGRAIAGVCINGVIIFLMLIAIPVFIQAARHAGQMRQQQTEQQQPQQ
jgi:hypothetical protein